MRKLIITRPVSQLLSENSFIEDIKKIGFKAELLPVCEYKAIESQELQDALEKSSSGFYTWHVFTSPHAVCFFSKAFKKINLSPKFIKIAVQGTGTAKELKHVFNRTPDLMPAQFISEVLAEELVAVTSESDSVLIPGSSESRRVIYETLSSKNISVTIVDLYTLAPLKSPIDGPIHQDSLILFFSPSAVTGFIDRLGRTNAQGLFNSQVISIGPITTRALKNAGFVNILEAREHSELGVLAVLSSLNSM